MKITISYIGNNINYNSDSHILYLSTSTAAKTQKNHLYIQNSHRPEKMFLLLSQALTLYLMERSEIKEVHVKDHFEILYYLVFYKSFLKIDSITYEKNSHQHFNSNAFLSKIMLKEAREFIEKNLNNLDDSIIPKRNFSLSIIMTTYNRINELEESLLALSKQSTQDFELIVINDGSNRPDVLDKHKELQKTFFSSHPKWKWIDQKNTYLGQARNNGAKHASGNCFLFLDDDNIPDFDMVKQYKNHWENFDFKIFTSCFHIFNENDPRIKQNWAPYPTPSFSKTLVNVISDAQCLVERETFLSLGQYTNDRNLGYEDWEFFLKALDKNIRIFPIVFNLYSYRIHKDNHSMRSNTDAYANISRGLRPLINNNPRLKNAFLINAALHAKDIKA